jgi:hypothetical protein
VIRLIIVCLALVVAVDLYVSRGTAQFPAPVDSPSPEEILRRSDEAMAALSSFSVEESLDGERLEIDGYLHRGTDCAFDDVHPRLLPAVYCVCGSPPYTVSYFHARTLLGDPEIYNVPDGARPIHDLRLRGIDFVDGRQVWVFTYRFTLPGVEGPVPFERREWIDMHSFLLLRLRDKIGDPLEQGHQTLKFRLYGFDEDPPPYCRRAKVIR